MGNDRAGGFALMVGSAGLIITLALHPSGHELFIPGQWEAAARKLTAVHSLALVCLPFLFLGALGLSRRQGWDDHWGRAALIFYGFSMAAVMTGVVLDGLVSPDLAREIVGATGTAGQGWRIALNYNSLLDMAFMRVFVVASSVAIGLWSTSMMRAREFGRAGGIYGLILTTATVVVLFSGLMGRYEHLFGIVFAGQAIWFFSAGLSLYGYRRP